MPTDNNPPESTPRFRQIVESLRSSIEIEALREHTSLPSERMIAAQFDVSRMTARKALEALEGEGVIYSEERRGRFVSPKRLQYNVSEMISFAADATTKGAPLEIDVIATQVIQADSKTASLMSINEGEELLEYTRLFQSKGHPVFVEVECVIAKLFPDFLSQDLKQSTTHLLEREYGKVTHTGDIAIRLCTVSDEEACLLGLMPHRAAIELEQVISDEKGRPFCKGRQIWRGERAEFRAHAIVH